MFYDKQDLEKGISHEMEHTEGDRALATKIAMDHLLGDKDYYKKLDNAGIENECDMNPLQQNAPVMEDDEIDLGTIAPGSVNPVSPSVAVVTIATPAADGQAKLSSSGLGGSGTPKPLKTTNLEAPPEKSKVGANKVSVTKTPSMSGNADPINHFGSQMIEKW